MRASASRCIPAEFSGARIRKKSRAGFPSREANCTPPRLRPKTATSRSIPGIFPWGIATPSPIPVLPQPLAVHQDRREAVGGKGRSRRQIASEAREGPLLRLRQEPIDRPRGRMSCILIEPPAP